MNWRYWIYDSCSTYHTSVLQTEKPNIPKNKQHKRQAYTDIQYINLDTKLVVISVIACFYIRRQNKRFAHGNISKMPIFGGF